MLHQLLVLHWVATALAAPQAYRLDMACPVPPPQGAPALYALPDDAPAGAVTLFFTDAEGKQRAIPADRFTLDGADMLAWRWDDVPEDARATLGLIVSPGETVESGDAVNTAYNPFLVRVKNAFTDAWVLKKYPSYATVLHDAGFRVDGRTEYVYGWWCAADVPLAGETKRLAEPDFEAVSSEEPAYVHDGPTAQCLTLEAQSVDMPSARIRSAYTFINGFPGVHVSRTFTTEQTGEKPWGGDGNWLGGASSWFPTHGTKTPSACYYAGAWHDTNPSEVQGAPQFFILYWNDDQFWLAGVLDPSTMTAPFETPRFRLAGGGLMMPAWHEDVPAFGTGRLGAWYFVGRSPKSDAVSRVEDLRAYLHALPGLTVTPTESLPMDTEPLAFTKTPPAPVAEHPNVATVTLENEALRLVFDPSTARVTQLTPLDIPAVGGGETGTSIYFTGAARWPRSLDWEDTDDRYLVSDCGAAVHRREGEDRFRFGPVTLRDPETNATVFTYDLHVELREREARLTASFTAQQEVRPDYLGWHFDFPEDRFRWYRQGTWDHDAARWAQYRMGFHDHQPMRYPLVGAAVTAYGEDVKLPSVHFHFLEETNTEYRALNLPNPLFDSPRGIQKTAMTATRLYWPRHNTLGETFEPGDIRTIAVAVRFEPDHPEPVDQGLIHLELPQAPDAAATLDAFWRDHCMGGPGGHAGVNAWWHALTGRFSKKMSYDAWRGSLATILAQQSDGTVDNGAGWTVPEGGLPHSPGAYGWNNGYLFEVNAHVVLSAEQYYLVAGDRAFIEEQRERLEKAIDFYLAMADETGLITLPEKYNGYSQYCSAFYWDAWHIGHHAAHGQMYAAAAAAALARLEEALGRSGAADHYEARAEKLREALHRHYWRGNGITDNGGKVIPGGRLLSWENVKGEVIDAGFTDLNLMAIASDVLTPDMARAVLTWLDHDPHAYAWRNTRTGKSVGIITFNTIDGNAKQVYVGEPGPRRYYAGGFNPFSDPPGMENGQTQAWVAGFDYYARARMGQGEVAGEKLLAFLERYAVGDLNRGHGVPESRPLPMFQGTSQMAPCDLPVGSDQSLGENGLVYGFGVVSGVYGLRCDYQGLYVDPDVPPAFADATITNLRYGRHNLTVRFHGHGDTVTRVEVDGAPVPGTRYLLPAEEGAWRVESVQTVVDVHLEGK